MRKSGLVAVVAVLVTLVVVPSAPSESYAGVSARIEGAHRASEGTRLGLTSTSDVLADPTHQHVFVSGGSDDSGVVVTDLTGRVLEHLSSTPGATGMTLSPDRKTLYVALSEGDGIREIDTTTLEGTTISTGADTCPQDVAVGARLVWFSYGCGGWDGWVGALDPETSAVTPEVISGFDAPPLLASVAALPGALFTSERGIEPKLARYAVTGADAPSAARVRVRKVGDYVRDMVETPSGKDLVVASTSVLNHRVYRTSTLAAHGSYTSAEFPVAVAVNEHGDVAAGIQGSMMRSLWVYRSGARKAFKTLSLDDSDLLQSRGLAFTGSTIYAVMNGSQGTRLRVISTLPSAPMRVTTDRHAYRYGARARVTVHLKTGGAQRRVSIYAIPRYGRPKLLRSGRLTGGTLSAAYVVRRQTDFTASYAGGSTYGPTNKSRRVEVHARVTTKAVGGYARQGAYTLFHRGQDPVWISTVAPDKSNTRAVLDAQTSMGGRWHDLPGSGHLMLLLDEKSQLRKVLRGHHTVGQIARVREVWGGDALNLRQTGAWSYVKFTR